VGDVLNARTFEKKYRELVSEFGKNRGNTACVECERCEGCNESTFCKDSERLLRCHFCVGCQGCTDSAHCRGSSTLTNCQHCTDCEACSASSYLVRSVGLVGCTYCFGCVGLSNKDFHILNQPYPRKEYFAITARLTKELRIG
jgi:hypothetical protein